MFIKTQVHAFEDSWRLSGFPPTCYWIEPEEDEGALNIMQCPFDKDLLMKFFKYSKQVVFDGIVFFDSFEKAYDNKSLWNCQFDQDKDWTDPLEEQYSKMEWLIRDIYELTSMNLLFVHYDNDAIYLAESSDVFEFSMNFPMNNKFFLCWLYDNENAKEYSKTMSRL